MKGSCFLIVNINGIADMKKKIPNLKFDELSIKVYVEIPDKLFKKPLLTAKIIIDENIPEFEREITISSANDILIKNGINITLVDPKISELEQEIIRLKEGK